MKLNIIYDFPKELQDLEIKNIHELLKGPTLIHLKGIDSNALFLSTLLHANETSSFIALQRLIKKYETKKLPRDLIIFIGNTYAAAKGMRHLPGQADYNRIWEIGDAPENRLAMDVLSYAKKQSLFASIDIHNNTGKNPLYGCVNVLEESFLNLAGHFGDHIVYFTEPHNVQSMAFSKICPSITIEAGLPGDENGISAVINFVDEILNSKEIQPHNLKKSTSIFHTLGRIKIKSDASVDFKDCDHNTADISLVSNIDMKNFMKIPAETHVGYAKDLQRLWVEGNDGSDITDAFFKLVNGELLTKRLFIPSMFTKDVYVMKEDCLGYIMEEINPF